MTEQTETVKNVLDFVAVFTAIGAFLQILTPVFGLIGAIVGVMRIYEMATDEARPACNDCSRHDKS